MIQDGMIRDMSREGVPVDGDRLPFEPIAFDGLFGWLNPGIARRGVVLCGTFGFEQLSAHRAWRALGERIAATGCSVLRFDYPGEGDSADDAPAYRTAPCIAAIRRAVRVLREEAGAEEIVLVGLRFGATLAARAAIEDRIDRLVLLAPFPSGRAYLREMKMRAGSIATLPSGATLPPEAGLLTVGGFHVDAEAAADLERIDLAALERPPAPRILVVGEAASLAARLSKLGAAVETRPFPGLASLIANPLFAQEPAEAFAAVAAFAGEGVLPRPGAVRAIGPSARIEGPSWSEEVVRFGPGLFGLLCRPRSTGPGPAVLFVNAGRNPHSGWGRQTTVRARRLAADGVASLRIDLGGLGDSADRPGGASPIYSLDALDDVRAALDALEVRGLGAAVIVGACSGAYLGFQALGREPRLTGALLINLYCFDWNPEQDVEAVLRNGFRSASTYAVLLRDGSAWRRLLRGEIRIGAIARALARKATDTLRQRIVRAVRPGPDGTVVRRIAALRRRGAQLRLVYSAGDPGLADLRLQLGRSPARHLGAPVAILADADHDLSTRAAQAHLDVHLQALLASCRDGEPVSRASSESGDGLAPP